MITPDDIETKVFSSSLRGYNKKEVDEFLDQIMIDYQALLDQNEKMLERVHVLQKQVAEAKDPTRMTQDAKRLMNDISASAEQKAEVIIKNAKHDAENIVRNAKNSTSQADEDAERLRRKVEKFKLRFKQMLEEEIDRVDDNSEDLLDDLRQDFYPTLLYGEKEQGETIVAGGAAMEEDPIAELPDVEPTGGLDEEESEDQLSELDQNPDGSEESDEELSDDTEALEEAEEEEEAPFDEVAPADEESEEAVEAEEIAESGEAEESEESAEAEEIAESGEAEEDEESEEAGENEENEEGFEGIPEEEFEEVSEEEPEDISSETIVIDRAALAKAQAELEEQVSEHARYDDQEPGEHDTAEEPFEESEESEDESEESEEAAGESELEKFIADDESEKTGDETLIIEKPEALEEAAEYEEYDDPDRAEPEEEPEPESEEEQAAKYAADYAGDAGTGSGGVTDDTIVIGDKAKEFKDSAAKFMNGLFQKKEN